MAEWQKSVPILLNGVLRDAVAKLEQAKRSDIPIQPTNMPHSDYLPIRTHREIASGETMGTLRIETVAGRGFWLFSLKHLLTKTLNVLLDHRWTIAKPYGDMSWFTSDDPVIKLNYNSPTDYNFSGGWGRKGTEIILPISPRHLLCTHIGERLPQRGWKFSKEDTEMLQRIIAKHAHRMILAAEPLPNVPAMRPRVVDPDAVRSEREQWETWHEQQTKAERELRGD